MNGREIKFRVWDRKLNKMWGPYTLQEMLKDTPSTDMFRERVKDFDFIEYTGLKDKNGVEIFEGDILIFDSIRELLLVSFNNKNHAQMWGWNLLDAKTGDASQYYYGHSPTDEHEVIGNLYEHPHLLEAEQAQ